MAIFRDKTKQGKGSCMAKVNEPYEYLIVESYRPEKTSGLHGAVHIRPAKKEKYPQSIHVECSKTLSNNYPVGTKFKLKVKLTDRKGGGKYLYSYYKWSFEAFTDKTA